mmetsp:Transcript_26890/g.63825  ORF Transcript_26890/g.63825 Transcript_26890/m.63825 type:complete len:210 (+) Transcript_26890:516-1145(+)
MTLPVWTPTRRRSGGDRGSRASTCTPLAALMASRANSAARMAWSGCFEVRLQAATNSSPMVSTLYIWCLITRLSRRRKSLMSMSTTASASIVRVSSSKSTMLQKTSVTSSTSSGATFSPRMRAAETFGGSIWFSSLSSEDCRLSSKSSADLLRRAVLGMECLLWPCLRRPLAAASGSSAGPDGRLLSPHPSLLSSLRSSRTETSMVLME